MRRITQQELEGLWGDIQRRAELARATEDLLGGQQNVLAVAYLLKEVEYLEQQIYELTGASATRLIDRPRIGEGRVRDSLWPIIVRRAIVAR